MSSPGFNSTSMPTTEWSDISAPLSPNLTSSSPTSSIHSSLLLSPRRSVFYTPSSIPEFSYQSHRSPRGRGLLRRRSLDAIPSLSFSRPSSPSRSPSRRNSSPLSMTSSNAVLPPEEKEDASYPSYIPLRQIPPIRRPPFNSITVQSESAFPSIRGGTTRILNSGGQWIPIHNSVAINKLNERLQEKKKVKDEKKVIEQPDATFDDLSPDSCDPFCGDNPDYWTREQLADYIVIILGTHSRVDIMGMTTEELRQIVKADLDQLFTNHVS